MTGARKVQVTPELSTHARKLLAIRTKRHWSQLELAEALDVARNTISRWERGEKDPHPAWVKLIDRLLETS